MLGGGGIPGLLTGKLLSKCLGLCPLLRPAPAHYTHSCVHPPAMLQNINVMAEPGTLTALVGGSGAGKTVRVAAAVSMGGFWLVAGAVWRSAA